MLLLLHLDEIASARGDGLRPELRRLFEELAARQSGNVVELDSQRGGFVQAGPAPAGRTPGFMPGNVVGYRQASTALPAVPNKIAANSDE